MITLTKEQEIAALRHVRKQLEDPNVWTPYVCILLVDWFRDHFSECRYAPDGMFESVQLINEVHEFLDGSVTVDSWLQASRVISYRFRLAIVDTLLARRGVY